PLVACALILALMACGPAPVRNAEPGGGKSSTSPAQAGPKVLTIALQRELTAFGDFYGGLANAGGGSVVNVGGNAPEVRRIAHVARAIALLDSAETPDPQTLVVHWTEVYAHADEAPALNPLPRHLLADLYARDKQAFSTSPVFTTEWVGLGPYRLVRWDAGVQ